MPRKSPAIRSIAKKKTYIAFGETKSLDEWSKDQRCKVTYTTLSKRVGRMGWEMEKAIDTEQLKKVPKLGFGETKTLKAWSEDERCVVTFGVLNSRINNGGSWTLEKALTTPFCHKKPTEFIGTTIHHLRVEEVVGKNQHGNAIVRCTCLYKNCGRTVIAPLHNVKNKQSCGCLRHESHMKRITTHGQARMGNGRNPYYSIWYNMNERCYDKTEANYKNYGGRGISVCDLWRRGQSNEAGLLAFTEWCKTHPRLSNKYSLNRIDNDGPYSPSNCEWSTTSEQAKNRRNVKYFEERLKAKDDIIAQLTSQLAQFTTHV